MENEYANFGLPTEPTTPPRRRPRGWLFRNLWWLLPTSVLVVVLPIGCCAGIFVWLIGSVKSSEPYQMALKRVCTDRQVIEALGEPVEEKSWMPTGNFFYHINNGVASGEADFSFTVSGSKDTALVHVEASCRDGKWEFRLLQATATDSGKVMSLLADENQTIGI